jgi:hypothetical protein
VNSFCSDRLLTALLMRSLRCRVGTPRSSHNAFCKPLLKLSKLSAKHTCTDSQFE